MSLREHGRRTKISKENKQADKEDNENVTVNVEDTETTDKEHRREIDNENIVDIGSPAWVLQRKRQTLWTYVHTLFSMWTQDTRRS